MKYLEILKKEIEQYDKEKEPGSIDTNITLVARAILELYELVKSGNKDKNF